MVILQQLLSTLITFLFDLTQKPTMVYVATISLYRYVNLFYVNFQLCGEGDWAWKRKRSKGVYGSKNVINEILGFNVEQSGRCCE